MKPYRIPQLAKPYTDYDMIQRHTELPPISDGRGHLLYIFLAGGSAAGLQSGELFTLVTSLVQLGLDTHEVIDRPDHEPGKDPMRSRQLKVLAGDYFSSWFYHLLAKSGQIEMVGILSTAIADFNVLKANLYVKLKDMLLSADQYLRHMVQLNMKLFLSFTPLIEARLLEQWERLLAEVSQYETLLLEQRRSCGLPDAVDGFIYLWLLETAAPEERELLRSRSFDLKEWNKLKLKYKCDSLLKDKLHRSVQSIQGLLQGMNDENLASELSVLLDRFLLQNRSANAALEG
ncbi:heptaprenyl diphosphate synthase component 1 [Paenibacillus donghaensis]|uniref:Heptaprenyl diphosphate synthase n=1 Tax=Paenibacillus donghaensis TaxID=414771 RepID=A0A2Z2KKK8_9BACL|nr:heptaprenyl diphosphate synthase component 1 [Paenibacillus donghaensis]ASA22929.1 heptaprenyl diphosphate synthase [Paenibacillus donghaensis]